MLNIEKIGSIMTKGVFSVEFDDSLKKVDDLMREENIDQVPVLENGKLLGMITQSTLREYALRKIYDSDDRSDDLGFNKISDFQNILEKNVHIIYPEDSVAKAIDIMTKKRVDYLPVVDWDNNLVGIITTMDILMFVKNQYLA